MGQAVKTWNVGRTKAARIADSADIRFLFTGYIPLCRENFTLEFQRAMRLGLPPVRTWLTKQAGALTGHERTSVDTAAVALMIGMTGEQTPPESLTGATSRFVRRNILGASRSRLQFRHDTGPRDAPGNMRRAAISERR